MLPISEDILRAFLKEADCRKAGDFMTAVDYMMQLQLHVKQLAMNGGQGSDEWRTSCQLARDYFALVGKAIQDYRLEYMARTVSAVEEVFRERFVRK